MTTARLLVALFFLISIPLVATAADLTELWSNRYGDGSEDRTVAVAVAGDGSIFMAGQFQGAINLGGANLVSAGSYDIYLARYTADGAHVWSRRYGDASSQSAFDLAVNSLGQPALVGSFQGTVDFGGGPLTSAGGYDVYVAKFDANGNHLWSRRYGDPSDQLGTGVGCGSGGHVAVTGLFSGTVNFGGDTLTSAGGTDVFLFQLDSSSGFHMWSDRFGDGNDQSALDLAAHVQGRITIVGRADGSINFGGGVLTSVGGSDVFIAQFESWGAHRWSDLYGGVQHDAAYGVDFHRSSQSVAVTGHFAVTANFGGAPLTSIGSTDLFLAKYDTNGNHMWSYRWGTNAQDIARDVSVSPLGEVAFTGYFEGSGSFGGGGVNSAGLSDLFIATYDLSGNHIESLTAGDGNRQEGEGVAYSDDGYLVAIGHFEGAVDLGGGPLYSAGSLDAYIARFEPITTGVTESLMPSRITLRAGPNPFRNETILSYRIPRSGEAAVQVYDLRGRLVRSLVRGVRDAGEHRVAWDGRDDRGRSMASGVYFLRLSAGGEERTGRLLLVR